MKTKTKVISKSIKRSSHNNPTVVIPKKQKIPRTSITIGIPSVKLSDSIKLPRKRRTKNKTRMYFTQETEDAIVVYNKEHDLEKRERLFQTFIQYPFQKLVENVFNTFKFSYFKTGPQDVQKECLSHLVANLHKFDPNRQSKTDPNKKTKAYSYFSIVAKHYLILLNNTNYKEFNQNVEISEEHEENTIQLQHDDKYYARKEMEDFIKLIIDFWEKNINKIFTKQRDLSIANAIVELIRNSQNISMFNKKAIYLYIREISACKTQQITKVINKMKVFHDRMKQAYCDEGVIETNIYQQV